MLFRGNQFVWVEKAGVPEKNDRHSTGKLTILVPIKIGVNCTSTNGVRTHNLSIKWLVITVLLRRQLGHRDPKSIY